jgi:hypothetical protein
MTTLNITKASSVVHIWSGVGWDGRPALKRVTLSGVYADGGETLDKSVEAAKKLSIFLGKPLAVYYNGLVTDVMPRQESIKELSEILYSVVSMGDVYELKKFTDNCTSMLKFSDKGCTSCDVQETCLQDNIPKSVLDISEMLLNTTTWGVTGNNLGTEDWDSSLGKHAGMTLVKSSIATDDLFCEEYPCITLIDLKEQSIKKAYSRVKARNVSAGKSRAFGNRECRNCVLSEASYGRSYCEDSSSKWRRQRCSGGVSPQELESFVKASVLNRWKVIPTYKNPGIHAAIQLIGCDATLSALGPRGHKGSVVRVTPSERKGEYLVKTVRSWGAYREQTFTLKRFIEEHPHLEHRLKRDKIPLTKEQSLILAWVLGSGKYTRNKMFYGSWEEDFSSIDVLGSKTLSVRLTNWRGLEFKSLADLHVPEYQDLWSLLRRPTSWDEEKNW